jgi:septal ring factor EnvC (AmiA/AmiB activator)
MRSIVIPVFGVLVLAASLCAEDNPEMHAAQDALRSAKSHLQAAPHDYAGHRRQAIEHVDRALADIREGLASVEAKQKKVEHKEQRLENRMQKLQKRDQQLKQ